MILRCKSSLLPDWFRGSFSCGPIRGIPLDASPFAAGELALRRLVLACSQSFSFLTQGPHIDFISSHFKWHLRHVMLHARVNEARQGPAIDHSSLTIRWSSGAHSLGISVCEDAGKEHASSASCCHDPKCRRCRLSCARPDSMLAHAS